MSTEKELMLAGKIYDSNDEELAKLREKAHKLSDEYNSTYESEGEKRQQIISELIPNLGEDVYLQGPIQFDYGCFTSIGDRTYANFNLLVLDTCPVKIGHDVLFGPNVSLLTAMHPMRWQERNAYKKEDGTLAAKEFGRPITVGNNCWLGGNVTVCGGVTIGDGCVIGAGSVVTKDIPPNSFAAGSPCKVIREITEEDKLSEDLF